MSIGRLQPTHKFNGWVIVDTLESEKDARRYLATCSFCDRHYNMEENSILMSVFDGCVPCLAKRNKPKFKLIFSQRASIRK